MSDEITPHKTEAGMEERRRRAAGLILEGEIVTGSLEYDEAEVLLNWALAQAERYAVSSKDLADEEADRHIAEGVGKVRRLMGLVNDFIENKDAFDSEEMVEELTRLLTAAMQDGEEGQHDR